jgi:2-oxoisovalerate dehydrogenase E1 component beta subunit
VSTTTTSPVQAREDAAKRRRDTITLAQALNDGLREALATDDQVLLMGEDIGKLGGVFRITDGLYADFGADRVIDTPLAEAGMVGVAVGMALAGLKPVLEIQFDGFIFPALNQICCHVARMARRVAEPDAMSIVIRVPVGGRIRATELHAESPEAYFAHTPELRVVAASDPRTAGSLLLAAIRDSRPYIFLEPKRLYHRQRVARQDVIPDAALDRARIVKQGRDVLLVAYGPSMDIALGAAAEMQPEVNVTVLDLVSLAPLDIAAVVSAVTANQGRLVVVTESIRRCSVASDLVSRIATDHFGALSAAPVVLSAPDEPYPAAIFEDDYIPSVAKVVQAVRSVVSS